MTSPAKRGAYFFLSYAHSAPSQVDPTDSDRWVRACYDDLSDRVSNLADAANGLATGFIDDLIGAGSDWNASLGDALAMAEVFVPLYSPGYFNREWPLRERESFLRRLREVEGNADKHRHILPVLWIPVFSWQVDRDIEEAVELGRDTPAYVDNGLRALCMLPSHRAEYDIMLGRIARRIVDVAENSPIGPSWAPQPEDLSGVTPAETQFLVAVAAPAGDRIPPGRKVDTYGTEPQAWRPFGEAQSLPVAQYVAHTAERLGLSARAVPLTAATAPVSQSAVLVLIDPSVAADEDGLAALTRALRSLPEWALRVVLVNRGDPQPLGELSRLVEDRRNRLDVMAVDDLQQLVAGLPVLVTQARRRYLLHGPKFTPKDFTVSAQQSRNDK